MPRSRSRRCNVVRLIPRTLAIPGAFHRWASQILTKRVRSSDDPATAGRLLNFFILEKAIYEIEYELAHRPDWLRVPLTGALGILSQQLEAP